MAKYHCFEAVIKHAKLGEYLVPLGLFTARHYALDCLNDSPALNTLPRSRGPGLLPILVGKGRLSCIHGLNGVLFSFGLGPESGSSQFDGPAPCLEDQVRVCGLDVVDEALALFRRLEARDFGICHGWGPRSSFVTPNVRAKLPAEAGFISPVRENVQGTVERAYKACRSGSA
jgi:hypothetical protein